MIIREVAAYWIPLSRSMTEKLNAPPHPKPSLRFGFDLSPHAGRGEESQQRGPSGKSLIAVQPSTKKYSASRLPQIKSIFAAVPSRQRGARDRHGRGTECGGRGCADNERRLMRTAKACGPDAPTLASSRRKQVSVGDGGKKARSPGRARYKP